MKLRDCTDKICELAKTQVAMICKDDADDCLSKYFTQKCADDDATCKAAREKVAAVCKQQSSPCVDKYYDMDCLPVDKFTINPEQIQAANYTLEGCRGQKFSQNTLPNKQSDKLNNNSHEPIRTQKGDLWSLGLQLSAAYIVGPGLESSGIDWNDPNLKNVRTETENIARLSIGTNLKKGSLGIITRGGLEIYDMGKTNANDLFKEDENIYVWSLEAGVGYYRQVNKWDIGISGTVGYAKINGSEVSAASFGRLSADDPVWEDLSHFYFRPQLEARLSEYSFGFFLGITLADSTYTGEPPTGGSDKPIIGLNSLDDDSYIGAPYFGIELNHDWVLK